MDVNPRLEVVPGADHTFTALAAQHRALELTTSWARALVVGDPDPAGGRGEIR